MGLKRGPSFKPITMMYQTADATDDPLLLVLFNKESSHGRLMSGPQLVLLIFYQVKATIITTSFLLGFCFDSGRKGKEVGRK